MAQSKDPVLDWKAFSVTEFCFLDSLGNQASTEKFSLK